MQWKFRFNSQIYDNISLCLKGVLLLLCLIIIGISVAETEVGIMANLQHQQDFFHWRINQAGDYDLALFGKQYTLRRVYPLCHLKVSEDDIILQTNKYQVKVSKYLPVITKYQDLHQKQWEKQ